MKQLLSLLFALLIVLGLAACRQEEPVATVTAPTVTQPVLQNLPQTPPATTGPTETATEPASTMPETVVSFSDLQYLTFTFSSGAGGWQTRLVIAPDGSFTGEFRDTNMGITAPEYPNGSVELCPFTGSFTHREQIDKHTYVLTLDDLTCAVTPGTVEIRDGVCYTYRTPYGLENAKELLLYLPGTPVSDLPEAFRNWVGLSAEVETLPFYGLYDPVGENGFSGRSSAEQLQQQVVDTEIISEQLNTWISSAANQADMSGYAIRKYALWEQVLQDLLSGMSDLLPTATMEAITAEQQQWLQAREAEVAETVAQMDADSYYDFVSNAAAAKITRNRVYELLELLPASGC